MRRVYATVLAVGMASVASVGAAAGTTSDSCEVRIGHLDTGIQDTHEEFEPGQIVAWQDFVKANNEGANGENEVTIPVVPRSDDWWRDPWNGTDGNGSDETDPDNGPAYDDHGHGTGTASLVAGETLGTRPGTEIAAAKVLNADGAGSIADIEAGFDFVTANGADVVTMSLGTLTPYPGALTSMDEQIADARDQGVLTVVAAGNNYYVPSETTAFGFSPDALVVGANDESGNVAGFSSPNPEVSALGVDVRTAYAGDAYRNWSGTSFSTPKVAGWAAELHAAACEQGIAREDRPAAIEQALKETAEDDPRQPYNDEGHGIVDAATVLEANRSLGDAPVDDTLPDTRNGASDRLRALWTAGTR